MSFFGNKRRDFSIQPPRQQVDGTPFFVTDSSNIDFTLENLNLTADLTFTGVAAGTYGDATHIPILEIDQWGRVTGVTLQLIGGGGGIDGANSRRWNGLNSAVAPPPGTSRLRTTSGVTAYDPSIVIDIRISRYDETNADMQAWFTALNNYRTANPGKAYIQITNSSNNSVFGIYQIGNMAYTSGVELYWTIGLTYISGSGLFVGGEIITFSWVLFGADGTGGGTYTVNNGLSSQTVPSVNTNNFQLGGTLIQDTSITGTTLYNLTLLGDYTGKQVLIVTNSNAGGDAIKGNSENGKAVEGTASGSGTGVQGNSNNGNAVVGVSTSGSGVQGQSTSGIGGSFSSTSGVGVQGASDANYAGKFTRGTSLNDSVIQNVLFRNITTNFPALNGFGVSLVLDTNTTNFATLGALAEIKALWTDANHATRTSQYEIHVTNNTNPQRVFNLSGPGQLTLDKYGQTPATFSGTPVWALGVDASGNVVEFTASPTTGDSISPFLLMGG